VGSSVYLTLRPVAGGQQLVIHPALSECFDTASVLEIAGLLGCYTEWQGYLYIEGNSLDFLTI
jgi:hypothetical protein